MVTRKLPVPAFQQFVSKCLQDWEELCDSEPGSPGSTEVHSAVSSLHSSPAGPTPQKCVAPPWLL